MTIPSDSTLVNLNQSFVNRGWYPFGFVDQFIRKIPFLKLERPTIEVNWNVPSSIVPMTVSPFLIDAALPSSAVEFIRKTISLQRIGDTALVDYLAQESSGNPNNLLDIQIQAKKVAIVRTLGQQIFQGNGTPPNLSGLSAVVTMGQQFTLSGTLPAIADLEKLLHTVRASDGCVGSGPDCIVTHERVVRYLCSLLADKGILGSIFDPTLGTAIPCYRGIPIFIGQVAEDGLSPYDIWALKIFGPTGIRLLHTAGQASEFGIGVESIPMQATKSQLGAFVGGLYGLMIPEPQSIARIQGVTNGLLSAAGIDALPV